MHYAAVSDYPVACDSQRYCATKKYAQEYVEHVALIRELLDQALSTNHALLMRSSNQLLRSLGGLLKGESDCKLTREPIPVWNLAKIVRMNSDADRVRQDYSVSV